jgi:hypothetical protein
MSKNQGNRDWLPAQQYHHYKLYKRHTAIVQKWLNVPQGMFSLIIVEAQKKKKEYDDKKEKVPYWYGWDFEQAISSREVVYSYYKQLEVANPSDTDLETQTRSHGHIIQL